MTAVTVASGLRGTASLGSGLILSGPPVHALAGRS